MREAGFDDAAAIDVTDVTWLPVVPNARQIFCVGLNYRAHVLETGRDMPAHPSIFLRLPATQQVRHESPLVIPRSSRRLEYEGEFAAIIGTRRRHIEFLPGDVIVIGRPSGVGARMDPPPFVTSDVVEVEIEGIGVLRNGVIDEGRA